MAKVMSVQTIINGRLATAAAVASKLYRPSDKDVEGLRKTLNGLALRYVGIIETEIARETHTKKIAERPGLGYSPDLITINSKSAATKEVKSSFISTYLTPRASGRGFNYEASVGKSINIGAPIKFTKGASRRLTTRISMSEEGDYTAKYTELNYSTIFVDYYKDKGYELLRSHLINPSLQEEKNIRKALVAIKKNVVLKAATLVLPLYVNRSKVNLVTLKFDEKELMNTATLTLSKDKETLSLQFSYPQSLINNAFKSLDKSSAVKRAAKEFDGEYLGVINTILDKAARGSKNSINNLTRTLAHLEEAINKQHFSADVTYVKGSVIAYRGKVRFSDRLKLARQYSGILDITQYVRGRVRLRMRRGAGVASPPRIYERSGTFRSSIEAWADFKSNRIDYFYLPYYDSLEKYGYKINDLVEGSIRAVAKERFNQEFQLRRKN